MAFFSGALLLPLDFLLFAVVFLVATAEVLAFTVGNRNSSQSAHKNTSSCVNRTVLSLRVHPSTKISTKSCNFFTHRN